MRFVQVSEQIQPNYNYEVAIASEALKAVCRVHEYLPDGQNIIDTDFYPWTNDDLSMTAWFTRNKPRVSGIVLFIRSRGHSEEKPQMVAVIDNQPKDLVIKSCLPDFNADDVLKRVKYVADKYVAEQESVVAQASTPYWKR